MVSRCFHVLKHSLLSVGVENEIARPKIPSNAGRPQLGYFSTEVVISQLPISRPIVPASFVLNATLVHTSVSGIHFLAARSRMSDSVFVWKEDFPQLRKYDTASIYQVEAPQRVHPLSYSQRR